MRILFLTDNFVPETNAPATRTLDHALRWVERGHDVTVLTCAPNFPSGRLHAGYRNRFVTRETIRGVRVVRVWSYMSRNAGFVRRTLDFVSYALMAALVGPLLRGDVIVATSPQFFTALAGWWVAMVRRRNWIFEVRDIWPESIKVVGAMNDSIVFRVFERIELFLYRRAAAVVPVTESIAAQLRRRGVPAEKLTLVPNGVRLARLQEDAATFHAVRARKRDQAITIGYLGTLGLAHGLDFIVRTARLRPAVRFVIVGDGAARQKVLDEIEKHNVTNVVVRRAVDRAAVPSVIAEFDYALVHLRNKPLFEGAIPSKIFENAALGVPILLGLRGEARTIIERFGAGLVFGPQDEPTMLEAIDRAVALHGTDEYRSMQAGCRALAAEYDRSDLADRLLAVIERLR